jgi:hypothetical protein
MNCWVASVIHSLGLDATKEFHMHLHLNYLNDRLKVAQLLLSYGLHLKQGIQLIVCLMNLIKLMVFLQWIHRSHNFLIQHLDSSAYVLQILVAPSDDAHPIVDFSEKICALSCVLV